MAESPQPIKDLSEYQDKVYRFLQNGKFGDVFTLDVICEKQNQALWIEIVKEYMAMTPWQGGWEFNADYTKLRRVDYRPYKKNDIFSKQYSNTAS